MTLKEAVLKSLDDINELTNYIRVYDNILSKQYYDFSAQKSPTTTVSAQLGDFIRNGDTRVKRIKMPGNTYSYYLTKNESNLDIDTLTEVIPTAKTHIEKGIEKIKTYQERDLHKLFSSYLKSIDVYSKTIFHEQSKSSVDKNQTWTHPDMVGIRFLKLQEKASTDFRKAINQRETFEINSYELKKEINTDAELKESFFQAVSNSTWANYGYLVALEFGGIVKEEMERLSQSFGIGIIQLNSNSFESKVLHPSKRRELDFKTIDKLCKMNTDFEKFITHIGNIITADDRYRSGTENELKDFCDKYFTVNSEMEIYNKEKNIPMEERDGTM